ncbi:TonB-dependent receptor domain-containing protein [Comamonas sp. UBA7840]|nr:TonB-dependent receptor [Comamonas sp. UBA7840]
MSKKSPVFSIKPTLLAVAAAACASAAAQEASQTLSEVVVSASGFEQDIKEAPASITVITRKQLEEKRVSNLAQALEDVEGVDVGAGTDKTGGPNISIRGMGADYTLILIDGRRQNAAGNVTPNDFGGTQTSFIPPVSAIERIEVIRGPMSTLYGSDAMGGVINIITRKVSKTWGGSITLDGSLQEESSFGDTYGGKFYLSGPIKQDVLGLALRGSNANRESADITYLDDLGAEVTPGMAANPVKSEINTLGVRLSLTPNRQHDIILDVESGRQRYDNSKGQMGTLGAAGGYTQEQKYNRDQWSLSHTGRYAFGVWDTSYMENKTETIGRINPTTLTGAGLSGGGLPRQLETTSKVLDSKVVMPLGNHLTTLGGQYMQVEMIDGVSTTGKWNFKQHALFAEDEWSLTDSFKLTLGGRYDHHSEFGSHFSPRIYGAWKANSFWTVKGGVSEGYKTPRVEQLSPGINGFGRQGALPLIGNPDLTPETSRSTELSFQFDDAQRFSGGITLFNNEFKDKIASGDPRPNCTYTTLPNQPNCINVGNWPTIAEFGQSINIDEAVTRGIELNGRYVINSAWSSSANYTYTESEQKSGENKGEPLTDTPKHAFNLRFDWKPSTQWSAWARAEYRSERYRGNPNSSDAATAAAAQALGDYKAFTQFHIGGSYKPSKQLTFNAAIYNLFNKNFVDYGSYQYINRGAMTTAYSNRYRNPQEGRRLWVSGTYEF